MAGSSATCGCAGRTDTFWLTDWLVGCLLSWHRLPCLQVPARSTDSYHEEDNGPPTEGLVFMGLISLVDPPREGVLEAVHK